jgi:hypothetical protein
MHFFAERGQDCWIGFVFCSAEGIAIEAFIECMKQSPQDETLC